jgi:hypothetical protein
MAVDSCEPEVIAALEKQGWRVKEKPMALRAGRRNVYADLRVSRLTEDFEEMRIVVEVKCFDDPKHDLQELYGALGQYLVYRVALENNPDYSPLYLSIPNEAYQRLDRVYRIERLLQRERINIVIIDIVRMEVVQWITWTPS